MKLPAKILVGVLFSLLVITFIGWTSAADRKVAAADPAVGDYAIQPDMNYPTAVLAANAFISRYEWRHGVIEDTQLETFLIHEATLMCESLDVDHSVPNAWTKGVSDGMSSDQTATVIDLAVEIYCPKHEGDGDTEAVL